MDKLNFLNVGCGNKFHKQWVNVDMNSNSPYVESVNLLKGIPFPNNQFDVIYHSHVLEHFPKEKAPDFISECFRVLKPGGMIRIVVPDLENIVNEYLKQLHENLDNPNRLSEANYDWILLEMYDQTVRNYSGGQMAEFLRQPELINEAYVIDRIGYIARSIRNDYLSTGERFEIATATHVAKRVIRYVLRRMKYIFSSKARSIGAFRLGGEIHMWIYDRYSLARLLRDHGFKNIIVRSPFESAIKKWDTYELDVKDGRVFDPTSLFMEARKPR